MKKSILIRLCVFVLLLSVFQCCLATSDGSEELHELWGISYNHNAKLVQNLVEINRGIKCEYKHFPKTNLTHAFDAIDSINDDELSLYGYPYHFSYTNDPSVFELRLSINGTREEQLVGFHAILDGLVGKYGTPDEATTELYSHGSTSWVMKRDVATHEIIELDPASIGDYDPDVVLASWPYTQAETEISFWMRQYNIKFECRFYTQDSDHCIIDILFFPSKTMIYKPVFEECTDPKPTKEPSDPNGF